MAAESLGLGVNPTSGVGPCPVAKRVARPARRLTLSPYAVLVNIIWSRVPHFPWSQHLMNIRALEWMLKEWGHWSRQQWSQCCVFSSLTVSGVHELVHKNYYILLVSVQPPLLPGLCTQKPTFSIHPSRQPLALCWHHGMLLLVY